MNTVTHPPSISSNAPVKSIFSSKTFWGIAFTTVAAVAPIVGNSVDAGKITGSDISQMVVILCGTGATLVGRIEAGNVYTPDLMPGPNKTDM
ncbi:hypothetical protein [Acaryochloris marina]|uniref:hypothetical protein n=1 Tax=Acaryochloris marina TaxID=155978 RepID=UPI001BAF88CB|nr:hypothetical protein [Acaryochloris marina]QUY45222.1 hypothetical protein I1H34_14630 [Acaryochloris marina S15]